MAGASLTGPGRIAPLFLSVAIVLSAFVAAASGGESARLSPSPPASRPVTIPTGSFAENAGQLHNADVRFYTTFGPLALGFARSAVLVKLSDDSALRRASSAMGGIGPHDVLGPGWTRGVLVRLEFDDANPVLPEGRSELPYRSNFFMGTDASRWRTAVRNYREVAYPTLYDGIDLVYRATESGLKYEFHVRPRADPSRIVMAYEGFDRLTIQEGGLVVRTAFGDLDDSAPIAYAESQAVRCDYALRAPNAVGFDCTGWDGTSPLVIDPLLYSTYLGGSLGNDWASSIAVDVAGNAYVTGVAGSSDFPTTPGAYNTSASAGGFITKLDPVGSSLVYSTFVGHAAPNAIAIDSAGNVYVAGAAFDGFPATPGAFAETWSGGTDAFVLKLNPAGSALDYATFLGGSSDENAISIAIDVQGNAFVTGGTRSPDFPTTPGALDRSYDGGTCAGGYSCGDVFIAKLDPAGSALLYSTLLGGGDDDVGYSIRVDSGGRAFVTGSTASTNFTTSPGAYNRTHQGAAGVPDAFVSLLNGVGSSLVYSTYLGGTNLDLGQGIAIDASGNAYVTGSTGSTDFPTTPGANDTTYNGDGDAFVVKLNPPGSALVYSTYLGGSQYLGDRGNSIQVDPAGDTVVTGATSSSDFPTTPGADDTTYGGGLCGIGPDPCFDAFVTKLDATGRWLVYSTFLGGSGSDAGGSIALDSNGDVYVAGSTTSLDFPVTPGAYDGIGAGTTRFNNTDAFVTKMSVPTSSTFYRITVDTSPAGLQVEVDGTSRTAPATFVCPATSTHLINGPSPQSLGPLTYVFESWSDGGAQAHSISCNANATYVATYTSILLPDFALSASPSQQTVTRGAYASFTVTAIELNGYAGAAVSVSLASAPQGISGTCFPAAIVPTGTCSLTVSVAASAVPGSYTLTIQGTNGTVTRSTSVVLDVFSQAGDFSLGLSTSLVEVRAGETGMVEILVAAHGGFNRSVALSASGLPTGVTVAFVPSTIAVAGRSNAAFSVSAQTVPGDYAIVIRGTTDGIDHTVTLTLRILPKAQEGGLSLLWVGLGAILVSVAVVFMALLILLARRPTRRGGEGSPPTPPIPPSGP